MQFPEAEEKRRELGVIALTSACSLKEFEYCEVLSRKAKAEGAAKVLPCFAIHPQTGVMDCDPKTASSLLEMPEKLASENRLAAVGECGFDLYNSEYKATEKWQEEIFTGHLEIALRYELPVVIHARRSMHKIFAFTKLLKKCRAVIFHSWQGTLEEGESFLKRGVNAYFSFGNTILNGHKKQLRCCALLAQDRILTETDAPYQMPRGKEFSSYIDLPKIIKAFSSLRNINEQELTIQIERNFLKEFA